ncbi:MAG: glycosyltransferase [Planctomycetia bacterium]
MTEAPRHITHIITGLDVGGAERALHTLLTHGLEGPFRNHVISLMGLGYYGRLLQQAGIHVTCLDMHPGRPSLLALMALRAAIAENTPDIIQGWMPHGNLAACLARYFFRRQSSLAWNIRITLENDRYESRLTRMITRFNASMSAAPRAIVYNSLRSRLNYEHLGYSARGSVFIPNGFNTDSWRPDIRDRVAVRNELGISEADRIIGFVGRGHHQKDIPNLFASITEIASSHPEAILVGVGRDLDRFGQPPRRFIPLGQRSDVPRIMRAFDILCLSSRAEGFPNVLGEAMATGVPCVTTDVGDARAIVGATGWVVPPRDSTALAQALRSALDASADEVQSRGYAARSRIQNDFSIAAIVGRYIALYDSLLAGRS